MFKIKAFNPRGGLNKIFYYDPHHASLTDSTGKNIVSSDLSAQIQYKKVFATSIDTPATKSTPKILKISLGLSCNYECEYCSQRFVPRAEETNKKDIDNFINNLDSWVLREPEKIEFWGGEPFVYWKTLKPLAEKLRIKYPNSKFLVITNGSLLTSEINSWLIKLDFIVGISHDGPGQHVRGPDPLDDPNSKKAILELYKALRPLNKISFNSMINRDNVSRAAIQEFFIKLTGDPTVPIGEGAFVDAYDEGGLASSLKDEEHTNFRVKAFKELRSGNVNNFQVVQQKVNEFIRHLQKKVPSSALGQKCGMDRSENIAVDLLGNVLTCQNTSIAGISPNKNSHKIGNVSDLANVKLNTSTHWSHRQECKNCPVLFLCKGSCMYLEGELWDTTCNNAYSDNIPIFAAAFELLTGYIPEHIEGPLREDRQDIWNFKPVSKPKRKVISIKPI